MGACPQTSYTGGNPTTKNCLEMSKKKTTSYEKGGKGEKTLMKIALYWTFDT